MLSSTNLIAGSVGMLGFSVPFAVHAWDGIVRHYIRLPRPMGVPGFSLSIGRRWAPVVGWMFAGIALFFVAISIVCTALLFQTCTQSVACTIGSFFHMPLPGWGCLAMGVGYFLMWRWLGDTRQKALVPGIWYSTEDMMKYVEQRFQKQSLPPPHESAIWRFWQLLLRYLRIERWAVMHGKYKAPPSVESMHATLVKNKPPYKHLSPEEDLLLFALLEFFSSAYEHGIKAPNSRIALNKRAQETKHFLYGNDH